MSEVLSVVVVYPSLLPPLLSLLALSGWPDRIKFSTPWWMRALRGGE